VAEIVIEHIARHARRRVQFVIDFDNATLTCLGETKDLPDFSVFSYDADRDLAYHVPAPLTPAQLEREVSIHFPEQLIEHLGQRPLASGLAEHVLLQPVISITTRISPLAALRALLDRVSDVNTAILHCEDGAMMLVRRAGAAYASHFSSESLQTFLSLPDKARGKHFPDFGALEILLTGSDVMHSDGARPLTLDLEKVRPIAASDLDTFATFSDAAGKEIIAREPIYAMHIGAALVVLDVVKDVRG
jgi:hypothetical protein